jgi:hypothetical protein
MIPGSILCALLLSCCLACQGGAQVTQSRTHSRTREKPKDDSNRSAADAHSFLELFIKLEDGCTQAEQKKDKAALESCLAAEFKVISADNPDSSLPRADWMQQALTTDQIQSYNQRSMQIRAFLGVAVVSFVQTQKATCAGKDCSGNYLVVDVWEAVQNKWHIATRYVARVADHSPPSGSKRK